jgi:hypothetical protein
MRITLLIIVLFFAANTLFACEYATAVYGIPMPKWVINPSIVQKDTTDSRKRKSNYGKNETSLHIKVYSGLGNSPDNAKRDAEAKIINDLRSQFGKDCSVKNEEVKCSDNGLIAKYKIEDEWYGQCFVDKFVVHLLVQTIDYNGKYINIRNIR